MVTEHDGLTLIVL